MLQKEATPLVLLTIFMDLHNHTTLKNSVHYGVISLQAKLFVYLYTRTNLCVHLHAHVYKNKI